MEALRGWVFHMGVDHSPPPVRIPPCTPSIARGQVAAKWRRVLSGPETRNPGLKNVIPAYSNPVTAIINLQPTPMHERIPPCTPSIACPKSTQGYLTHKKQRLPRTLQWDYA